MEESSRRREAAVSKAKDKRDRYLKRVWAEMQDGNVVEEGNAKKQRREQGSRATTITTAATDTTTTTTTTTRTPYRYNPTRLSAADRELIASAQMIAASRAEVLTTTSATRRQLEGELIRATASETTAAPTKTRTTAAYRATKPTKPATPVQSASTKKHKGLECWVFNKHNTSLPKHLYPKENDKELRKALMDKYTSSQMMAMGAAIGGGRNRTGYVSYMIRKLE